MYSRHRRLPGEEMGEDKEMLWVNYHVLFGSPMSWARVNGEEAREKAKRSLCDIRSFTWERSAKQLQEALRARM
jgi:hypothetical protein